MDIAKLAEAAYLKSMAIKDSCFPQDAREYIFSEESPDIQNYWIEIAKALEEANNGLA